MPGPLHGFTVIDLTQAVSGPFATMLLADQGADVIKVEPVTGVGDFMRLPFYAKGGLGAYYMNLNRGKRSVSVDLSGDEGTELILHLCSQADVFVQNFRPGAIDRLGLGYDAVRAVRPDIVYVSISGFGPTGPYAGRPVLDPIVQALCGIVDRQVNPLVPIPDVVRTIVADKSTSLTVAQAVTAALLARERGNGGQHVEISMLDATMYFFWPDGMMDLTLTDPDVSGGRLLSQSYGITECEDGHLVYFAATEAQRAGLYRALGHPELADDERAVKPAAMAADPAFAARLGGIIADAFAAMPVGEAIARLLEHEVPVGPVLSGPEVPMDPQVVHSGTLVEWQHPDAGTVRQPRPAARFAVTPASVPEMVAHRGQHNDEVLAEFGVDSERIAALRAAGVIG